MFETWRKDKLYDEYSVNELVDNRDSNDYDEI